jgi:hypothetical protein
MNKTILVGALAVGLVWMLSRKERSATIPLNTSSDVIALAQQGGYLNTSFAQETAPIKVSGPNISDAERSDLLARQAADIYRGGTYDEVNAQAIGDFLAGIVSSVWVSGRGGTNPRTEYADWKKNHIVG